MTCPLCEIPKTEKLLYEDDSIYLVETKDKKGHEIRAMIAIKRHDKNPSFQEQVKALFVLNQYMQRMTDEWYVCDSTHATIRSHWHTVSCDTSSKDKKEVIQLSKTEKVLLPIGGNNL